MSKILEAAPLPAEGDPLLSHGELILELILASLAGETRALLACMQVSRAWRSAARSPSLWHEIRWPAHLPLTPDLLTRTLALSSEGGVRALDLSIPMEAWCDKPSTLNPQPLNSKPSTLNPQPLNPKP